MQPQPHTDRHMWFAQAILCLHSAFEFHSWSWSGLDCIISALQFYVWGAGTDGIGLLDAVSLVCMASYSFLLSLDASACLTVVQRKCMRHAKAAGMFCSPCRVVCRACTEASNVYSFVCCVHANLHSS